MVSVCVCWRGECRVGTPWYCTHIDKILQLSYKLVACLCVQVHMYLHAYLWCVWGGGGWCECEWEARGGGGGEGGVG